VRAIERPGGAVLFHHRFDRTADRPFRPADDRAPVIRRYYPHAPSPAGPRPRPWGLSTAFITTRLGYGVCVAFTTGVWVGAVRKPVEGGAHPAKRPRGPAAGPASSCSMVEGTGSAKLLFSKADEAPGTSMGAPQGDSRFVTARASYASGGFVARTRSGFSDQAMSRYGSRTLRRGFPGPCELLRTPSRRTSQNSPSSTSVNSLLASPSGKIHR
jgi:hypothetical protein